MKVGRGRYWVALGMFLLTLLLYIDRICISVAKDPISGELGLDDKMMGWVLSSFALGYALLQVPSGMLVDRAGPRKVLTSIVALWSTLTALTGAAWNLVSLLVVRFLFGAGEAGAFPGLSKVVFSWIPLRERGFIIGLNFSGSRLGAAFALPFVAWLIENYGWRMSFVVLGVIGVLWAVLWWLAFRDTPETHSGISEKEKNNIVTQRQQVLTTDQEKLSWKELLRSVNVWSAIGQYFCSNFTFFFALTWLFPYLKGKYALENTEAGWYTIAPFLAGAIGNWVAGIVVDQIYSKGNWNLSRKVPAMIGFFLAGLGMLLSLSMDTPFGAVAMLSMAIFGADMTLSPSWSLCVDIGKKNAGTVSGTMNMAGNLGSFFTALAFPYLTSWTGSVDYFFYTAAILNVIAIILWMLVKADRGLAY